MTNYPQGVMITEDLSSEMLEILTPDALAFLAKLERNFGKRVDALLIKRGAWKERLRHGAKLDFLPETKKIRDSEWKIHGIPKDLQDRRVEITGPVDKKMVINALNSGAKCFMADFEDASSPRWDKMIEGQISMRDAIRGTLRYTSPDGKEYQLNDTHYPSPKLAILIVRPRGWHLPENHIRIDNAPIHGALMDFGLYFFHNAKYLVEHGTAPYFYLPKLEHHAEAALWSEVFTFAESELGLPTPTIKATVLIETITAAFEMEEILYAMKDHIVAQNAGRWDYIFSYIKNHAYNPAFVCPDRHRITMAQPFLKAYAALLVHTCHKRGAMAMGGMAALIPIKGDDEANAKAMDGVRADKRREATAGHDGTWVAHPALIPIAQEIFDEIMPTPNQLHQLRSDIQITAEDLLRVPEGVITEAGARNNISVALQYIASWLNGNGCVPIFNLMEDAATAEISRTQLWQWIKHHAIMENGKQFEPKLFKVLLTEEYKRIKDNYTGIYNPYCLQQAHELLEMMVLNGNLDDFLTTQAYNLL